MYHRSLLLRDTSYSDQFFVSMFRLLRLLICMKRHRGKIQTTILLKTIDSYFIWKNIKTKIPTNASSSCSKEVWVYISSYHVIIHPSAKIWCARKYRFKIIKTTCNPVNRQLSSNTYNVPKLIKSIKNNELDEWTDRLCSKMHSHPRNGVKHYVISKITAWNIFKDIVHHRKKKISRHDNMFNNSKGF